MDETDYEVFVDGESIGIMNTGLGGKLSLSVTLAAADHVDVKIVKQEGETGTDNGKGEDDNGFFLPELRLRIRKVDGTVPGL